ncbi:hypothetical protein [Streptomyces netropsis]|uniref:SaeA second Fn3-like domain-containing protein n=1 Tax=Streptomyces netropsis TaxID=55404 RepID=A0A7W7LEL0_STRNE|nr:hypothetical protein [Streptomyces netropsis]MBB4888283.1 hypothetical protein [Streptomyces netropsis]GGR30412.1 hypothetical protein GCM10010219_39160 [Streptomyces netropsis]
MGRDFGDLLGLPQALPGMPLSPLVPGWAELRAAERAAGFRHAADALLPPGGTPGGYFLVLDGLRVPGRGGRRRHVDRALLAEVRDARLRAGAPEPVRSLFARYDAALAEHPMALRRVVLYQLLQLLRDAPRGPGPDAATALGVDPAEAAALAHAARRAARTTPAARAAAETLVDVWRAGNTRRAHTLTRQLPAPAGDQRLAHLVARIDSRARRTDALLREAHALERRMATDAAADHYLRAVRTAEDDTDALHGLLRTCRPTGLRTEVRQDGVRLRWPADPVGPADPASPDGAADRTWRLLRGTVGRDEWTEVTATPTPTSGGDVVDAAAPLGERLRYAALPLDGDRVAGRPLVSAEVLAAPEVSDVTLTDGRARVDARWRTPPGARRVTVVRTGPAPAATDVPAGPHGFTDQGLPPGEHRYRIHCVYRTAAGREVRSPGVTAHRTVHPWPDPVTGLTVRQGGTPGVLSVDWTGGARGQVRLLDWPGTPPTPGEDLRTPAADLPAELAWPPCGAPRAGGAEYRPPTGATTRVTAVTVLGDRAVAGPSVRVDVPEGVPELTARRVEPTRARLTFDWPRATDRVRVRWWQADGTHERRLTRSTYLREGLHLDITRAAAHFRVEPLAVADADVVLPPASAETGLPADVAVSYAVDRPGFLTGRRRRVTVRAATPEPVGESHEGALEMPEFVLVARAGDAPRRAPDPPRTVRDGIPVLRLSGAELLAGPVRRDIDAAVADAGVRRPYTLRAFLTGPHAHAVRLEEPPHKDLVVR